MAPTPSQKRRVRLIRQLQNARQSLELWETSLTVAAVQSAIARSNDPSPSAMLLVIVNQAKVAITVRLGELGARDANHPNGLTNVRAHQGPTANPSSSVPSLKDCIDACRACGRVLGAAFCEAQRVADAASARVLYGFIRALEKQLWLLDPRQAYQL